MLSSKVKSVLLHFFPLLKFISISAYKALFIFIRALIESCTVTVEVDVQVLLTINMCFIVCNTQM